MLQSPYFNINYGWPYGTDGWNTGMDENLLALSFLDRHTVDQFVTSLPPTASVGSSYILSADNNAYIYLENGWFFVTISEGYEFRLTSDNTRWRKTASGYEQINSTDDVQDQVDGLDQQLNGIGGIEDRLLESRDDIGVLQTEVSGILCDASSLSVSSDGQTQPLSDWMGYVRDRDNQTGTQPTSTIENFSEEALDVVYNAVQSLTLSKGLTSGFFYLEHKGSVATELVSESGTLTIPDEGSVTVPLTETISDVVMPSGEFGVVKQVFVEFVQPETGAPFDVTAWGSGITWLGGVPVINLELDSTTLIHFVNVSNTGWTGWQEGYVPDLPKAAEVEVVDAGNYFASNDVEGVLQEVGSSLEGKVDKEAGMGLSQESFTTAEKDKLDGIESGATTNSTDAYLLSRANHTGTQAISTVAGLQGELDAIGGLIGDIGSALDAINGEVV